MSKNLNKDLDVIIADVDDYSQAQSDTQKSEWGPPLDRLLGQKQPAMLFSREAPG